MILDERVATFFFDPWVSSWLALESVLTEGLTRVTAAVAAGVGLSLAWRSLGATQIAWLQRRQRDVTDSAFDLVIEEAVRRKRVVEIWPIGEPEPRYRGWVHTFARESAQAAPWMFISDVEERSGGEWDRVPGTHGFMFHRENIQRLRIYKSAEEWALERAQLEETGGPSEHNSR
jgi:hypothetical protein